MKTYGTDGIIDLAVVGAGPAGLALLKAAADHGLRAAAIEKGPVCGALMRHPAYMRWFSTADKLELPGLPLLIQEKNPTRREYLHYCRAYARHFQLPVNTYREVTGIITLDGLFRVEARDLYARKYIWRAKNVAVATGFYDGPRPLEARGADLPKVSYRYTEAHPYAGHRVLIVGAGSSAAETALELYREGAHVTIAMRASHFNTKYWIEPDIENRIREGAIACYRNVEVLEIRPDDVILRDIEDNCIAVENDFVLAMTGYTPDLSLLRFLQAAIDAESGKPIIGGHCETSVPGIYVAGGIVAGNESNSIFIENGREHGARIVEHILARDAKPLRL